jgi:hypothetical protein
MLNSVRLGVCFAAAAFLTACSSMPTWTKPSVWYDQLVTDPQAVEKAAAEDAAKAGKPKEPEGDFPNLANTPAVPAAGLTAAQQREVRDSLAADRAATKAAVSAVREVETPETRANAAAKPPGR